MEKEKKQQNLSNNRPEVASFDSGVFDWEGELLLCFPGGHGIKQLDSSRPMSPPLPGDRVW
jgi:hypothetical protein